MGLRGRQEQSGLGLAASAVVGVGVIANIKGVDRHSPRDFAVDGLYGRLRRPAGGDVWLVRHHDGQKAGRFECLHRRGNAIEQPQVFNARRRHRLSCAFQVCIQHPVAVEKDGSHHLVAFTCRSGCDTRQCQITA